MISKDKPNVATEMPHGYVWQCIAEVCSYSAMASRTEYIYDYELRASTGYVSPPVYMILRTRNTTGSITTVLLYCTVIYMRAVCIVDTIRQCMELDRIRYRVVQHHFLHSEQGGGFDIIVQQLNMYSTRQ